MATVMVIWFGLTDTPNVFLSHPNVPFSAFLTLVFINVFMVGQDFFQTIINSNAIGETNIVTRTVTAAMPPHFFDNLWILVGQAWSLGSELLFYAIAPFIVRSVKRLVVCLCISLAIRFGLIFGLHGFDSTVWGYNFFPATCCLFCLGSLSYHLYPKLAGNRIAPLAGLWITAAFATFALVSMLFWQAILPVGPGGLDTIWLWLAYILFALSLPLLFGFWRRNRIDRWIGELSYPLYLVHGAVIGFIFAKLHAGQMVKEDLAIAMSVGAAIAIFMCIDRPVDAWRHRHFGGGAPHKVKRRAIGREWIVLAGVAVLMLANTLRLAAFAHPVAAPPILAAVDRNYNIVNYDGRVFGVPQGDPITFGGPNYDRDPRLIIGTQVSEVQAQIDAGHLPDLLRVTEHDNPGPDGLVGVDGSYNIVIYAGRVFGVPQGVAITWGAPGYDRDKRFVIGSTVQEVRTQVDLFLSHPINPPILLTVNGHYNIIQYDGRVFGVPQGMAVSWGTPGYDKNKNLVIGHSAAAVLAQIDPTIKPEKIVGVDQNYDIVLYAGRFFGVPQTLHINWGAPGYDQNNQLIIADTAAAAHQQIDLFLLNQRDPPILLSVDGHYNIVRYQGRIFGVPQGIQINWGAPGYDQDKNFVITATMQQTVSQVDHILATQPAPAILLEVDGAYNIVRYNGRVFGVPQGVAITWGAPGYDKTPGLQIGASPEAVRDLIAKRAAPP
jgi:peptidoglycan/LPS O-acetylase OafA/YrhL/uncharacterized protein YdhG (YjbR/CyaY superfamily)